MKLKKSQSGIAHLGLLLLLPAVALIGFAGYTVNKQQNDKKTSSQTVHVDAPQPKASKVYVDDKKVQEAFVNIDKAATIAELETAVNENFFYKNYEVNSLDGSGSLILGPGEYMVNDVDQVAKVQAKYVYPTEADLPQLKSYSKILLGEITKYPKPTVEKLGLFAFVFVKDLKSEDGAPGYGVTDRFILYDFDSIQKAGDAYGRHVIHHEFAHSLDANGLLGVSSPSIDDMPNDPNWTKLNDPGFVYKSDSGNNEDYGTEHPQTGFVSDYSMSNEQEDKSEVMGYLMTKEGYNTLMKWTKTDAILKKKVDYLVAALDKDSPGFAKDLQARATIR